MSVDFTLNSFTGFDEGEVVHAPYDIVLTMTAISDNGDHSYDNWAWSEICTNTQFDATGTDEDTGDDVTYTMNTATPTCEADGTELTIHITDDLDGMDPADWDEFTMTW
jgi:hypothetical protein